MTKARSDAISMISTFRFRKDKGGFADLGPVTIQTALVTGSAATALQAQAPEVARVQVVGVPASGPDTPDVHKRKLKLIGCVKGIDDKATLNAIAEKVSATISEDSLDDTKAQINTKIDGLSPLALEELEQFDEMKNSCPQ